LVIDSTGLKVFGEGEWKVKKHGQERRRIWRKLHLAVDSKTHEIICADLSLNGTVAKLAMRQRFVLFKGLTFQKLCLPGAFRPGDHHN
ncbi:transposase, partial [Klebsiella variicola]|uniref:transposase n=1 Tax=Klebsiella variicola TaxID=244366 RepID=UPI001E462F1B